MSSEPNADLAEAGERLSEAVGGMASSVLGMDSERARCAHLAERYDDFSTRVRHEYPSLAGPAARLAELWRDLEAALGRLTAHSERVIVAGDDLAARTRSAAEDGRMRP